MPLTAPVAVIPVPVVIIVLRPFWGPPLTLSLWEWVRREVSKVRATAVVGAGRERTGVVLETVEIGRWETVRVSRRVLVINLLGHDRRGRGVRHGRRGHHVGVSALSGRCSRDGWVIRARHWRGHGWETGRSWKRVSHLVVGERGPDWAGRDGALG